MLLSSFFQFAPGSFFKSFNRLVCYFFHSSLISDFSFLFLFITSFPLPIFPCLLPSSLFTSRPCTLFFHLLPLYLLAHASPIHSLYPPFDLTFPPTFYGPYFLSHSSRLLLIFISL